MSETYPAIPSEPVQMLKPGYQTTEFWITIIVQIIATISVVLPEDSAWQKVFAMLMSILSAIAYNSQRGTLKQRSLEAAEAITRALRPRVNILLAACCLLLTAGCAVDRVSVQADQARKTAVEPVVREYMENHPEQATTWLDFLTSWQKSIDARAKN